MKMTTILGLGIVGVLALMYTGAGQKIKDFLSGIGGGVAEFGAGWQTGISAILSPKIEPEISAKIGLEICVPWIPGITGFLQPCTVSTREGGSTPGSGTTSTGGVLPIPSSAEATKWMDAGYWWDPYKGWIKI